MKIPYEIIRQNDRLIELHSRFHYWILLKNTQDNTSYFLYHKYNLQDAYHRQEKKSLPLSLAVHKIKKHDEFIATTKETSSTLFLRPENRSLPTSGFLSPPYE